MSSVGSLDLGALAEAYRSGGIRPSDVAAAIAARIEAAGDDHVWISRVPAAALLARAAALDLLDEAQRATLPLFGIPFAVKDNFDVAGMETTAGCPGYAYRPRQDAAVVTSLLGAGAMLVGKTNLDQFATGLVGVRSPYGIARNPFDPAYIPGGSSSGSAVAVAAGLVSFALGTDTAGSGRVPAAFNNIVGLKPTRGLVSTTGLVPACRSLDCVSIFALTVEDSLAVLGVLAKEDPSDPYSRKPPETPTGLANPPRVGIPGPEHLEFFGNLDIEHLYRRAVSRLEQSGARIIPIDFTPFAQAAELLYYGPWVAERTAAVGDFISVNPGAALPVTAQIIGGHRVNGVATFQAMYRLQALRQAASRAFDTIDLLLVPTTGTIYTIEQVLADPIATNSNLGRYTNFTNLLDLSAIAVPAGFQPGGLPAGVTLLAPAFREAALGHVAAALQQATGMTLGATGLALPPPSPIAYGAAGLPALFVVGAHLAGQPLNWQLAELGARLLRACRTAGCYRLYALGGTPARPGMVRVTHGGAAIEGEVWQLTHEAFGRFLGGVPSPLSIGTVELADGSRVKGFLCESAALDGAEEITAHGGWRAWRAAGTSAP